MSLMLLLAMLLSVMANLLASKMGDTGIALATAEEEQG